MKRIKTGVFLLMTVTFCLLLSLVSCEPPKGKTKAEVMQERLAKKYQNWYSSYSSKCKKSILDEAAAIVDSTLIAQARRARLQMLKPPKPIKPGQPNIEMPEDTTPIAPLFDLLLLLGDTTLLDSLQLDSLNMDSLLIDSIMHMNLSPVDSLNN